MPTEEEKKRAEEKREEEKKRIREIAKSDAFDDLCYHVREAKEWMAKEWKRDDLLSFVEDMRKALDEIEDAAWGDADTISDPDADHEDEKEGPFVVLLSDHYWARAASFVKARARLNGETPRLAYLTNDKGAYVDGLGSFCYKPDTAWFKMHLGRRLNGEREGTPGGIDFYIPETEKPDAAETAAK